MILPNSSVSATSMKTLQEILSNNRKAWFNNYSWRPAKLFYGANMLLTFALLEKKKINQETYSSKYYKWYSKYRKYLFDTISYNKVNNYIVEGSIPKIPNSQFLKILDKIDNSDGKHKLYYFRAVLYWIKILAKKPIFLEDGEPKESGEMKEYGFKGEDLRNIVGSVLSSSTYFVFYTIYSSCQVINQGDFLLPFNDSNISQEVKENLSDLFTEYQNDLKKIVK